MILALGQQRCLAGCQVLAGLCAKERGKNNFGSSPIGWHWLSERKKFCHLRETFIASGASVPETGTDVESPKLFLPHPQACNKNSIQPEDPDTMPQPPLREGSRRRPVRNLHLERCGQAQ